MKKIFIVDDDESFVKVMTAALDPKKYEVLAATDGEDGLEKMTHFKPDIILLDIRMPKMNGIDFLRKVNEIYGQGKTPVIITSNIASLEQISEGVSLGIRGYIVKSNESLHGIVSAVEGILA